MKTIGYWSTLGGVEVKNIEYGVEDYVVCVSGAWNGKAKTHRLKVKYTGKGSYVTLYGSRLYLDECIRCVCG